MTGSVITNTSALSARSAYNVNQASANAAISKLATGKRIVKASDDAASNAIQRQLSADIAALTQASSNASQGSSLIEVANGALNRQGDMLIRMKTLATQSNNGTLGDAQRGYLQQEFASLRTQIGDTATQTRFNGTQLLTGGAGTATMNGGAVTAAVTGEDAGGAEFAVDPVTTGLVYGQATAASVTKTGTNFNMSVTIGDQTFTGSAAGGAGAITFTLASTTNSNNTVAFVTAATIAETTDTAASVQTALQNYLNINGAPAFFTSAAISDVANGTSVASASAGAGVDAGVYQLTYDTTSATTGNLTLQYQDGTSWTTAIDSAASTTATFGNGLSVTMGALGTGATQFDYSTSQAVGFRLTVGEGSGVSMNFQVGEQAATDVITLAFTPSTTSSLGLSGLTVGTVAGAVAASTAIDAAIATVVSAQADLGAIQSRFNFVSTNLSTLIENSTAVKGTFLDQDMAQGQIDFVSASTLADAAIQMLAQANTQPGKLIKLLQ